MQSTVLQNNFLQSVARLALSHLWFGDVLAAFSVGVTSDMMEPVTELDVRDEKAGERGRKSGEERYERRGE